MVRIPTLKCKRCGHAWIPRIADVRLCPKCKTARWDEPKKSAQK
jgi:predicted Zn-ribbon and HTH transcriptional regulator